MLTSEAKRIKELEAERDEWITRAQNGHADNLSFIEQLQKAEKRNAELEAVLGELRGHIADVAMAGMLIGETVSETHKRISAKGRAMLSLITAAIKEKNDADAR